MKIHASLPSTWQRVDLVSMNMLKKIQENKKTFSSINNAFIDNIYLNFIQKLTSYAK